MIDRIKALYAAWKKKRAEEKEEELRYMARQYCQMSDRACVPCILVSGVPLYLVTDEKTDLAAFNVNIKDCEHVINTIRVKYSVMKKQN